MQIIYASLLLSVLCQVLEDTRPHKPDMHPSLSTMSDLTSLTESESSASQSSARIVRLMEAKNIAEEGHPSSSDSLGKSNKMVIVQYTKLADGNEDIEVKTYFCSDILQAKTVIMLHFTAMH